MKAIIIAAGSGKRINSKVKKLPKSMIPVNGKPILEHQISTLNEIGINEIYVITGPYSDKFTINNIQYVKDLKYLEHDILGSLMEAKNFLDDDVVIIYSDIIFEKKIMLQILESKNEISIAIDMNWEKMYEGRTEHPKTEAENVLLDEKNQILKIQKNIINSNNKVGEFLGIIKLTSKGGEIFTKIHDDLVVNHKGTFHEAPSIFKAYLTDFIQELIDLEIFVQPIFISGKWCEIDTEQDLMKAEKIFN